MDITGSVSISARFREVIPPRPGNANQMRVYHRVGIRPYRFTYGTGPGQANIVWTSAETIAFDYTAFSYIVPSLYLRAIYRGTHGAAFDVIRYIEIRNLEQTPGRDLIVGNIGYPDSWTLPWNTPDGSSIVPAGSSWIAHNHLDGWPVGHENTVLGLKPLVADVAVEMIIVGVGWIAE